MMNHEKGINFISYGDFFNHRNAPNIYQTIYAHKEYRQDFPM